MSGVKELESVACANIPSWLSEEFFADIFRKRHNKSDDLKVKIVSIKPAIGAGENYVATLFRVVVEVNGKTHSLIVKFSEGDKDNLLGYPMFPNEMHMYSKIIPALENEFKRIDEEVHFSPKCYLVRNEPAAIIVLEDLRPSGYSVHNRFDGVDINHCKVFLSKLAKFHAAGAVFYDSHEDLKFVFKSPYTYEYRKITTDWIGANLKFLIEGMRNNDVLRSLADKVAKWETLAVPEINRITESDPNTFNVLNHGDPWINNYLFSYDETSHPSDLLLIDFQISSWGSPALDLLYFFVSSAQHELIDSEFDNLIHFYHTELTDNLRKLGYKRNMPTLKELHIDLLKNGFWAAYNCMNVMAVELLEPMEGLSVADLFGDSEKGHALKRIMFQSSRYMTRLEKLFPFLDRKGLLEL